MLEGDAEGSIVDGGVGSLVGCLLGFLDGFRVVGALVGLYGQGRMQKYVSVLHTAAGLQQSDDVEQP